MSVSTKLPELREDLHGNIPHERRLSLYDIEHEMADLVLFRDECQTDEERAACDQQIAEYAQREVRKVTNIAALYRYFRAHENTAKAEQERIAKQRQKWERAAERVKALVLGVMQSLEIPKLESATDRFRRQKNPVALEITDAKLIPEQYLKATVRMPFETWKELIGDDWVFNPDFVSVTSEVDTAAVKAALATGEVPGARLTQGEHLRIE